MMPKQDDNETARQKLGSVIRFYRDERHLNRAQAADRCGTTAGTVEAWEGGRAVPDNRTWARLKNMVAGGLAGYEHLLQRARAEEEAERAVQAARVTGDALTQRPFAAALSKTAEAQPAPEPPKLTVVPEPPPEPPEPAVPETLVGENYDLSKAYIATQRLPAGWRSAAAIAERSRYARELLKAGRSKAAVVRMVREQFTVGIGMPIVDGILEELEAERAAAEHAARPRQPPPEPPLPEPAPEPAPPPAPPVLLEAIEYARMLFRKGAMKDAEVNPLLRSWFGVELPAEQLAEMRAEGRRARTSAEIPVVAAPPPEEVQAPPAAPAVRDNDVEGAVRLILEAIPNLRSFRIEVDESGEVRVEHAVREVRVIETTGTFKIKK